LTCRLGRNKSFLRDCKFSRFFCKELNSYCYNCVQPYNSEYYIIITVIHRSAGSSSLCSTQGWFRKTRRLKWNSDAHTVLYLNSPKHWVSIWMSIQIR
jgi:hypothetical protein